MASEWEDPVNAKVHSTLSRLNRARRRAGIDRNPMRRREDHIQSAVAILLVLIFLMGAPLTAGFAGSRVYGSGVATERAEHAARHQVTAVIRDGEVAASRVFGASAQVSWVGKDGTRHTAVYQGSDVNTNGTVRVWVDPSDNLVSIPRRHVQTVTDTVLAVTGALLALAIPLLIVYNLVRRQMDMRRYRLWDLGWQRASVRWRRTRPDQP